MTDYYEALVSKNQSKVQIASNVKFFENTAEIPIGAGLWVTASEIPREFRIDAMDVEARQVASLAMMKEYKGDDALAAIRLKVDECVKSHKPVTPAPAPTGGNKLQRESITS